MGFGIPDEIMELIRDSVLFNPDEIIIEHAETSLPTDSSHIAAQTIKTKLYYPPNVRNEKPTYTSLNEQEVFLASSYFCIYCVCVKKQLKSPIIIDYFSQLSNYYQKLFLVMDLDSHKLLEIGRNRNDTKAAQFIMGSMIGGLLRRFDSPELSKPDFRDILDDLFYIAKAWSIAPAESKSRSDYFFSYIMNVYGLRQSEFFSCPYCGEPLVKGIAFCPRCFENSRDTVTPRYHPSTQNMTSVLGNNYAKPSDDAVRLHIAEEGKWELSKQLKVLGDQVQADHSVEKISELTATIEKLQALLNERDKTIKALTRYYDCAADEISRPQNHKILVFGASTLSNDELKVIADDVGLTGIEIVFQTDYVKLRQFAARVKKDSSYVGIVLGPAPHRIKEKSGSASPAAYFSGSGFPFVVEAKTYSGQLKLTRQSARMAFAVMFQHLLSAGYYS